MFRADRDALRPREERRIHIQKKRGVSLLLTPLFKALGRAQLTGLSNGLHAVYVYTPNPFQAGMLEMSPSRYITYPVASIAAVSRSE